MTTNYYYYYYYYYYDYYYYYYWWVNGENMHAPKGGRSTGYSRDCTTPVDVQPDCRNPHLSRATFCCEIMGTVE